MIKFLVFFLVVHSASARAVELSKLIGLDSNVPATEAFAKSNGFKELRATVKPLGNTNTYVTFDAESSLAVKHKPVVVLLKPTMSSDEFMEALIKVFTLRSLSALTITVAVNCPLDQVKIVEPTGEEIPLAIKQMLATAGATSIFDSKQLSSGKPRRLNRVTTIAGSKENVFLSKSVITGDIHPGLQKELAEHLQGVTPVSLSDLKSMKNAQVFLLAPAPMPANHNLLKALSQIQMITKAGGYVHWIVSKFPYDQSDKSEPGVAPVVRLIADLGVLSGAREFTYVRSHTQMVDGVVGTGINPVSGHATLGPDIQSMGVTQIISADIGASKDNSEYAKDLAINRKTVINKSRDRSNQAVSVVDRLGPSLEGQIGAAIDDLVESGGSLGQTEDEVMKENPKEIRFYAVHLTSDAHKFLNREGSTSILTVTNTLPTNVKSDRLRVISIAPELAHALQPFVVEPTVLQKCKLEMSFGS